MIKNFLKSIIKKNKDEFNSEFKEYNYLDLKILYRPIVPNEYFKKYNELKKIKMIGKCLNQYYFLLYIPENKTKMRKELAFYLDRFTHHNYIYKIYLNDLIDFIFNNYEVNSVSFMTLLLDQYHKLYDTKKYNNKLKILDVLINDLYPVNIMISERKISDDISIYNIPDVNKMHYDYFFNESQDSIIPEYFFDIQVKHENIPRDQYSFIESIAKNIIVLEKTEDKISILYNISYEKINKNLYSIIENSAFKYLSKIDNLNYLNELLDKNKKEEIFLNLEELDNNVDEIIEESELQDKELNK